LERFTALDIRTYPADHAEDREKLDLFTPHIPFAVVASDEIHPVNGKKVRGRQYRWGVVEVENPKHCDFVHLRELLIRFAFPEILKTDFPLVKIYKI
jgi:septin family protein